MSEPKDGGPAFPSTSIYRNSDGTVSGQTMYSLNGVLTGMSLRDYFAGQALVILGAYGYVDAIKQSAYKAGEEDTKRIARQVYEMADVMLAERAK